MKLSEYKFVKKEDKIVFKVLMRCLKEEGRLLSSAKSATSVIGPKRYGFEEIIRRCYASRKTHGGETFLTNIYYWPSDAGGLFSSGNIMQLIYVALLINSLNVEPKELGTRFKELFKGLMNVPKSAMFTNLEGYSEQFFNALVKTGTPEKKAKEQIELLELLVKAAEHNIPF